MASEPRTGQGMHTCRNRLTELASAKWEGASNAGLLLDKYYAADWHTDGREPEHAPEAKRNLLSAAREAAKSAARQCNAGSREGIYQRAFGRWEQELPIKGDGTAHRLVKVDGRMIVGLGGENVLETGITLNRTYGTPIIPGSALKGTLRHYVRHNYGDWPKSVASSTSGQGKPAPPGDWRDQLFGTTKYGGTIQFHDAWWDPDDGGLALDVLTPHHRDYYGSKQIAPTDFDDPVPVQFLSVTGRFLVCVSCPPCGDGTDDPRARQECASQAMFLLLEALKEWGVGGKTSSGYGRLADPDELVPFPAPHDEIDVWVIGPRSKGGYDVRHGKHNGLWTTGSPPAGLQLNTKHRVVVERVDETGASRRFFVRSPPQRT